MTDVEFARLWCASSLGGIHIDSSDKSLVRVAKALTSLLPATDDSHPVNADWLVKIARTVDLSWHGNGPERAYILPGERIGVRWIYAPEDRGWHAYLMIGDEFDGKEDYLCPVPTRGDLRRLVKTLTGEVTP